MEDDLNKLCVHKKKCADSEKQFIVARISKGGFFGQEDVYCDGRMYTVLCNSHIGCVYEIPKKEFIRYTYKDEENKNILEDEYEIRNKIRSDRVENYKSVILENNQQAYFLPKSKFKSKKISQFVQLSDKVNSKGKAKTERFHSQDKHETQWKSVLKLFGIREKLTPKSPSTYNKNGKHIGVDKITPERVRPTEIKGLKKLMQNILNINCKNSQGFTEDNLQIYVHSQDNTINKSAKEYLQKSEYSSNTQQNEYQQSFNHPNRFHTETLENDKILFETTSNLSSIIHKIPKKALNYEFNSKDNFEKSSYFLPLKYQSKGIKIKHNNQAFKNWNSRSALLTSFGKGNK